MKKLFRCVALFVCALSFSSVSAQGSADEEPIRFGVGLDPAFVSIYYAAQNNLFQEEGLNVDLLLLTQAADALDAVIAGQNQLGAGSESSVLTRASRGDMKAFVIYGDLPSYIKLTVREGITKPEQIKNFGVVPGSAGEYSSREMLKKHNIDPSTINWVRAAPPEFPALLARGDVDAYFLWEPWPTRGKAVGGSVLMTSGDVGYSSTMLVATSGEWLENNPDKAKKVAQALSKACEAINADPEIAAVATQKATKLPLAQARDLLQDVNCKVRDFTQEDMKMFAGIADFQINNGLVKTRADVESMVQTGYVTGAD